MCKLVKCLSTRLVGKEVFGLSNSILRASTQAFNHRQLMEIDYWLTTERHCSNAYDDTRLINHHPCLLGIYSDQELEAVATKGC